jgi:hypothetical protein
VVVRTLLDPEIAHRSARRQPAVLHCVDPSTTAEVARCFLDAPTTIRPLVAEAYRQLVEQTNRQYALLTDSRGPYRLRVVDTRQATPYTGAGELIAAVRSTRVLEMTAAPADRAHPLLDGAVGGSHSRLRAVHDLIGHVATGYGFDADGEYSAWLVQQRLYTGLARWAAATELHGEISVLWTTHQFADHKAALLDPALLRHNRVQVGRAALTRDGYGRGRCSSGQRVGSAITGSSNPPRSPAKEPSCPTTTAQPI